MFFKTILSPILIGWRGIFFMNGSFRDECLNVNWFFYLEDAQEKFDIWKGDYNGFRPHSSLGDMSPNEYMEINKNSRDSPVLTCT